MVSVDSARRDGMTDFITLKVSHYEWRSNVEVAAQVIEFLLRRRFEEDS
ncbi:MAG: hypothetical protein QNJ73_08975 [Gammaproteobacteria bacterium]|nr:hypothetical protein [Gammaproteobacteria bacterium]